MQTIRERLVGRYIQARNERILAFAEDNVGRNPCRPVISYRYLRLLGEQMAYRVILEDLFFEPLTSMKEEKMHVTHGIQAKIIPSYQPSSKPACFTILMPLQKNIPEPCHDWDLRACPSCGQECWYQTGNINHIRAMLGKDTEHDRFILLCTECALKMKQEEGNDGNM